MKKDTLGRSLEASRTPKGISTQEVSRMWNLGHTIDWIAARHGCSVQNIKMHLNKAIDEGMQVRRKQYTLGTVLTRLIKTDDDYRADAKGDKQSASTLSLAQLILLKYLFRAGKQGIELSMLAAFYWQTTRSLVRRGLMQMNSKRGWITDAGNIAAGSEPPLEILLKEV